MGFSFDLVKRELYLNFEVNKLWELLENVGEKSYEQGVTDTKEDPDVLAEEYEKGVASRDDEIQSLEMKVERLEERIEDLETQISDLKYEVRKLERENEILQDNLDDCRHDHE